MNILTNQQINQHCSGLCWQKSPGKMLNEALKVPHLDYNIVSTITCNKINSQVLKVLLADDCGGIFSLIDLFKKKDKTVSGETMYIIQYLSSLIL